MPFEQPKIDTGGPKTPEKSTPEKPKKTGKVLEFFNKLGKGFDEVGDNMEVIKKEEEKVAKKELKKYEKRLREIKG
ncbi:hypothetical protein KAI52_02510 [Candidatus Parcubacteria bacterium]|nr:hypothetical protein [Candidatus Parcubacteria bacterium]